MKYLILALMCAFSWPVLAQAPEAGLQWKKYEEITPDAKTELLSINPKLAEFISASKSVFYIYADTNRDGNRDFVLYFADPQECGADGCLYVIADTANKKMKPYTAFSFKLSKEGVIIDDELVE